ncbi:MAG: hypothetical protein EBT92_19410, partial [Planctomycetes bacterium]|nr:hypothetical protein [Planctomycetota bacterium]
EASDATKATRIANAVTVGAGANALVVGNLVTAADSTQQIVPGITVNGTGTINITGKIDGAAATNDLTLTAANGAITLGGAVGGTAATPTLDVFTINGSNSLLASGTINIARIEVGNTTPFTSSVTFAEAVTVVNNLVVKTSGTGTVSFAKTITGTGGTTTIDLTSVNGSITVTGNITGKSHVTIESTGSGAISVAGITTDQNGGAYIEIVSDTGNITTSGEISGKGSSSEIYINNDNGGDITINGDVSTGTDGNIYLIIGHNDIGNGNLDINGEVYTTGIYTIPVRGISISSGCAGTVNVNKPISTNGSIYLNVSAQTNTLNVAKDATLTSGYQVGFSTQDSNNTFNLASGANVTAVLGVFDNGTGTLNLGANITTTAGSIQIDNMAINLTGAVSMKVSGTSADITLGTVNGAQNLTLEAPAVVGSTITLTSVGQTTALNTVTVINSGDVLFNGAFTAADVVLLDTSHSVIFNGQTVISNSLTTTAESYNLTFNFGHTAVIHGAPVFLNTGDIHFFGTTTILSSGATIAGGSLANVSLAGTIVSGGAFNIGPGLSKITISGGTQLILNSASAGSTFASLISLNGQSTGSFNLLGVGTLTLSADSTAGVTTGDSINVTNGTLNVTGTLGSALTITLTNGTLTGPGGTVGSLTPAIGTVAPGGTL